MSVENTLHEEVYRTDINDSGNIITRWVFFSYTFSHPVVHIEYKPFNCVILDETNFTNFVFLENGNILADYRTCKDKKIVRDFACIMKGVTVDYISCFSPYYSNPFINVFCKEDVLTITPSHSHAQGFQMGNVSKYDSLAVIQNRVFGKYLGNPLGSIKKNIDCSADHIEIFSFAVFCDDYISFFNEKGCFTEADAYFDNDYFDNKIDLCIDHVSDIMKDGLSILVQHTDGVIVRYSPFENFIEVFKGYKNIQQVIDKDLEPTSQSYQFDSFTKTTSFHDKDIVIKNKGVAPKIANLEDILYIYGSHDLCVEWDVKSEYPCLVGYESKRSIEGCTVYRKGCRLVSVWDEKGPYKNQILIVFHDYHAFEIAGDITDEEEDINQIGFLDFRGRFRVVDKKILEIQRKYRTGRIEIDDTARDTFNGETYIKRPVNNSFASFQPSARPNQILKRVDVYFV